GCQESLHRGREALQLYVAIWLARIHERAATGNVQTIWVIPWIGAVHAQRISRDEHREGRAAAGLIDRTNLPSIRHPTKRRGRFLQLGRVPQKTDHSVVAQIEIGEAAPRLGIEPKRKTRRRVRKLVAGKCRRSSVDAAAPGVRPAELQSMTE